MRPYRCAIYFSDGKFTWSETYYYVANNVGEAFYALNLLSQARAAITAKGIDQSWLRAGSDDGSRDVAIGGGYSAGQMESEAGSWDALHIRMHAHSSAPNHRYWRSLHLSGLPASWLLAVSQPGGKLPPGADIDVRNYLDTVVRLGFHMRTLATAHPWHKIDGLTTFADDECDVAGNPLHPRTLTPDLGLLVLHLAKRGIADTTGIRFEAGSKIQIKGMAPYPCADGLVRNPKGFHTLTDYVSGFCFLTTALLAAPLPTPSGYLRLHGIAYAPIQGWLYGGVSRRKRGGRSSYARPLPPALPPPPPPPIAGPGAPPPELIGPVAPPPGGIPVSTLQNFVDTQKEIWKGYDGDEQGIKHPIGIAKVLNRSNTYMVFISGTDLQWNQATGIPEDIFTSLFQPDIFTNRVMAVCEENIPKGTGLLIAGHSLGGMAGQNAIFGLERLSFTVAKFSSSGSPLTNFETAHTDYRRIGLTGDTVPALSPFGILSAPFGLPEQQYYTDPDIPTDPYHAHIGYVDSTVLRQLGPMGIPLVEDSDPTLQLGPVTRFTVPVIPPKQLLEVI